MTESVTFDERFSKFTPSAIATLTLAKEEAHRHNQNYIGTEHLLLGMIRQGAGIGSTILTNLGAELSGLDATIEDTLSRSGPKWGGEIGLTPRSKQVIELAVEEARSFGHTFIGQE